MFQLASADPRLGLSQSSYMGDSPALVGGGVGDAVETLKRKRATAGPSPLENHKMAKKAHKLQAQGQCWPRCSCHPPLVPSGFLLRYLSSSCTPHPASLGEEATCLGYSVQQQCQGKSVFGILSSSVACFSLLTYN